jgi:hypothetical protein
MVVLVQVVIEVVTAAAVEQVQAVETVQKLMAETVEVELRHLIQALQ